jgi:uncharacterized membrane protein YhhN
MRFMLLILGTLVSGGLHIRAEYWGPRLHCYLFKPLTTTLILLLAWQQPNPITPFYRYAIVGGLALSLLGDVWLMLPTDRFLQGLVSFLLAHLFYIAAFAAQSNFSSLWSLLPFLVYGVFILRWLWPTLGKLKGPVMLYMAVILIMGWQAWGQWQQTGQLRALWALCGALLFILSDSVLAFDHFRQRFPAARFVVLSTYYLAQLLIAASVGKPA